VQGIDVQQHRMLLLLESLHTMQALGCCVATLRVLQQAQKMTAELPTWMLCASSMMMTALFQLMPDSWLRDCSRSRSGSRSSGSQ
jgi:hypothetical protein